MLGAITPFVYSLLYYTVQRHISRTFVSFFLWLACLYLTVSLSPRSCHSCLGQSAARDSGLRPECSTHFLAYLETHQRQEGFWDFSSLPCTEDCGRDGSSQVANSLLSCSGGSCCDFYQWTLLAPTHPRRPECRRSTRVFPPAKNKSLSFPLSVDGLLSLVFGWPVSDALLAS